MEFYMVVLYLLQTLLHKSVPSSSTSLLRFFELVCLRVFCPSFAVNHLVKAPFCVHPKTGDGDRFHKAMEVLFEMKGLGLCPNNITYSIVIVASGKKDDLEAAQMLLSQAKMDGVPPNPVMCRCIIGMCLRRYEKACNVGELSFDSRQPHVNNKWTSLALMVYREMIRDGMLLPLLSSGTDFEGEAVSKCRFGACNKGKKPSSTDMHGPVVLTIE
ncbi:hypothetical protein K1719_014914 [Acacia pycnantha]|nr:hypothetical protein K1719_014914 [Acacia pycnantha]